MSLLPVSYLFICLVLLLSFPYSTSSILSFLYFVQTILSASIYPCINPSTNQHNHPSIHPLIQPLIHASIQLVTSSTYSSIHSPVRYLLLYVMNLALYPMALHSLGGGVSQNVCHFHLPCTCCGCSVHCTDKMQMPHRVQRRTRASFQPLVGCPLLWFQCLCCQGSRE